jgi:hypothetical protein
LENYCRAELDEFAAVVLSLASLKPGPGFAYLMRTTALPFWLIISGPVVSFPDAIDFSTTPREPVFSLPWLAWWGERLGEIFATNNGLTLGLCAVYPLSKYD